MPSALQWPLDGPVAVANAPGSAVRPELDTVDVVAKVQSSSLADLPLLRPPSLELQQLDLGTK